MSNFSLSLLLFASFIKLFGAKKTTRETSPNIRLLTVNFDQPALGFLLITISFLSHSFFFNLMRATVEFAHFVAAIIGSISSNGCHIVGRRSYRSCASRRIERMQFIFLRTISHNGATISSRHRDSGCIVWRRCRPTDIHVLGRSECIRRANIDTTIAG